MFRALWPESSPAASVLPTITTPDGLKIYRRVPPYLLASGAVLLAARGGFFVTEGSNWRTRTTNHDVESTLMDTVSHRRLRPSGQPLFSPDVLENRNARGRKAAYLYVTVCTPGGSVCTSAYEPVSEALRANREKLALSAALCGVSCAFVVLLVLVLESHSRSMEQQLRRAIRNDALCLFYQPIVNLVTGRIVEAEALLRWTDEDGYKVSPEVFVRIAEERGFMRDLTAWVTRRALRDFAPLLRERPDLLLNINVAASDLADEKFLPMLERSLLETGVAAERLAIEVTEGSTASTPAARETIHQLRLRGHRVQIDDFGTGYSSLAYLKDLQVDTIKVDRSFTHSIGTESVTVAILPQILAMAHALGLQVIIEGIETVEQAGYFAGQEKAVLGQGWLFGHAVPLAEFLQLLKAVPAEQETSNLMG